MHPNDHEERLRRQLTRSEDSAVQPLTMSTCKQKGTANTLERRLLVYMYVGPKALCFQFSPCLQLSDMPAMEHITMAMESLIHSAAMANYEADAS